MKKVILILIVLMIIIVPFLMNGSLGEKTINIQDIDFHNIISIENNLKQIIKVGDLGEEEAKKILLSLPDLDWDKLNRYGRRFKRDLVNWLRERDIDDVDEISALIRILNKFKAYDNELLTRKLANIFIEDKETFIKALALNKGNLLELGYAFFYLELYGEEGGRYLTDDFNDILNSERLTKEEKLVGFEFLEIIASCET